MSWVVAIIVIVLALILLGVLLYFFVFRRSNPTPAPTPPTPAPTPPTPVPPIMVVWSDNIQVGTVKLTSMIDQVKGLVKPLLTSYTPADAEIVASTLGVSLVPVLFPNAFTDLTYARVGDNDVIGLRASSETITYTSSAFKTAYSISSVTATPLQLTGTISTKNWIVLETGTTPASNLVAPPLSNTSGTDYLIFNNRVVSAYQTPMQISRDIITAVTSSQTSEQVRTKFTRITDVILRSNAISSCVRMACVVLVNDTGPRPCQCVQVQRLSASQNYPLASATLTPSVLAQYCYSISYDTQARYGVASSTISESTIRIGNQTHNAHIIVNDVMTFIVGWSRVTVGVNAFSTGPYWLGLVTSTDQVLSSSLTA